jgi:ketosteroid isomerase-like protein
MTGTLTADDQLAIRDTIARYAWALDTGDVDGFVACFCRDGVLVWDAFEKPERWEGAEGLRHFAEFFRSLPSSAANTMSAIRWSSRGARALAAGHTSRWRCARAMVRTCST